MPSPKPIKPTDPWDRRLNETPAAYAAFVVYRDQGITRSQHKTAEAIGKSRGLLCGWSRQHNWVDRATAWDDHLQRQHDLEAVAAIRAMGDRHANTALLMQQKAIEALQAMNPSRLSPAEIRNFLVDAIKLERQARGEPDKIDVTTRGEQLTVSVRKAPEQVEDVEAVLQMAEILKRSHMMSDADYDELVAMAAADHDGQPQAHVVESGAAQE
jgi:hypothetical protein